LKSLTVLKLYKLSHLGVISPILLSLSLSLSLSKRKKSHVLLQLSLTVRVSGMEYGPIFSSQDDLIHYLQ
jgi:hypothetical protein